MYINEFVREELPDFKGIVIPDGAAYLEKIRDFRVTVAWKFKIQNALKYKKVLIAGNMKNRNYNNKGDYFIADIIGIVTIRELVKLPKYTEIVDYQNENFNNWISRDINTRNNIDPLGIDIRNAILFNNPTEIKEFSSSNFRNLSNPVTYID